ncbi:RSP_7527 family protein [Amylibacter sp. SFDW26]|nr:hypothetical protein [Amylibacter sp. SFDW26]
MTNLDTKIDYVAIEATARKLRAEAMQNAGTQFVAWIKSFKLSPKLRFAH